MALTVEDGTGLATADAYASIAEVDAYLALFGTPSAWVESSEVQKEQAIRRATRYLDARFGKRWRGRRTLETQALDWPRFNAIDSDGFAVDSDAVPQAVKDATAEMAHRARSEDPMPDISEPGTIKSTRIRVGPIEDETVYLGGKRQVKDFRLVDNLLKDLVGSVGQMERA